MNEWTKNKNQSKTPQVAHKHLTQRSTIVKHLWGTTAHLRMTIIMTAYKSESIGQDRRLGCCQARCKHHNDCGRHCGRTSTRRHTVIILQQLHLACVCVCACVAVGVRPLKNVQNAYLFSGHEVSLRYKENTRGPMKVKLHSFTCVLSSLNYTTDTN